MKQEEEKAIGVPENAFRELKPGEVYNPLMSPDKKYPEVNLWSVLWGIAMAVLFSAAAAYLGLKVGQVFEAAIPIAIIAVGVSGGKDSLTLLTLLAALREYVPYSYDLTAITIDMGLGGMDFSPVARLCERLGVPYSRVETEIGPIIFEHRKENNPCSLCAKMRRGALNQALLEQGFSKVALGHHYDDAVETFLMSLLFEGRIGCFEPVTYLDRTGVTQIRPMLYLTEGMVRTFAAEHDLPVVHNPCPADKHTKRQEIKELVAVLSKTYPDLKARVFGAMQRLPLPQWGVTPHQRGSQKQLHQHDGCKAGQAEKADDAGRGRGDGDIEPGQGRE